MCSLRKRQRSTNCDGEGGKKISEVFREYLRAGDVTRTTPQNSDLFVIAVLLQM